MRIYIYIYIIYAAQKHRAQETFKNYFDLNRQLQMYLFALNATIPIRLYNEILQIIG